MTAPYRADALAPDTNVPSQAPLILALPKGRILAECGPLLARVGLVPDADYDDEDSRRLRFPTNDPNLDVVRVRPFDVATFVAYGRRAHRYLRRRRAWRIRLSGDLCAARPWHWCVPCLGRGAAG